MARNDRRVTTRRSVKAPPRIALTRQEIHNLAPHLIDYWVTKAAGRRITVDRDELVIALRWWVILGRAILRAVASLFHSKDKGKGKRRPKAPPHKMTVPMAAIVMCRWRKGWWRHYLVIDAPGCNDPWHRGGKPRPYKLRGLHGQRKREALAWVAACVYWRRPELRPPAPQLGFPRLTGKPQPARRPGWTVTRAADTAKGRRRKADPRRHDGRDWARARFTGRGLPIRSLLDADLADTSMRNALAGRRRRR